MVPGDCMFVESLATGLGELGPNGQLLIGVSGGADSVALLHGLVKLPERPQLFVVHIDHQLRPTSESDARWVSDFAEQLGVPCTVVTEDVAKVAEVERIGIEEAARNVRYGAFADEAERIGANYVAVAHHADDNVETILHNIVRGTGLHGLCGIPQRRQLTDNVELVRPMLSIRRAQILEYLCENNVSFLNDETNSDTVFTRNRIRHELLPLLERDFNPQVRDAIERLAQQASDVTAAVDEQVQQLLSRVCSEVDGVIRIRCDLLRKVPRSIVRSLMRAVWIEQQWPRQKMGFHEWDSLAAIVFDECSGRDLPGGVNASRRRAVLALTRAGA